MATTNSLKSVCNNHQSLRRRRRHSMDCAPPSSASYSLFSKPTNSTSTHSLSSRSTIGTAFALSSSSTTSSSSPRPSTTSLQPISFDVLEQHLSAKNYRQADEETRRLLIALAGDAAVKRGYVFFSEVQFISETDLKAIDDLWKQHSNGRFGYSVQKKIWNKANRDFSRFFVRVGWMKKLDTEVEQYNYRSFPTEFIWEMDDETPKGHLPLTNALRGTQLLTSIFNHPAFEAEGDEAEEGGDEQGLVNGASEDVNGGLRRSSSSNPLSKGLFKPNYSF